MNLLYRRSNVVDEPHNHLPMFHCDLCKLYDVDHILLGIQVHRHIQLNYHSLDKYDQLDSGSLYMDRLVGDENGISKCHNYDFKKLSHR